MLVISRPRQIPLQEQPEEIETASQLASRFNAIVLTVPFLYDFSADNLVVERLRSLQEPAYFLMPISRRSAKSLLDKLQIPYVDVFETVDAVQIPEGAVKGGQLEVLEGIPQPRWYPLIDTSRCTGCLECVNYCLFGVYAIGNESLPLVDQPDACRDGCPACARVCPSKAIIFPLCEERDIAGYGDSQTNMPQTDILDNLVDLVDNI